MQSVYKYRFSRRTIYVSIIYLIVFALLGWALYHLYEGGYLSAWFTSFIVALIALMALSIPRKIVVSEDRIEVRCLLDITEIRRDEIASVRRVETRRMKWFIPIFGGYGFFGYYGHFIDLRRLDRVRIYASEWRNFVEITDIYDDRLYVSCADADRLVAELTPPGGNRPDDEEIDEEEEGPEQEVSGQKDAEQKGSELEATRQEVTEQKGSEQEATGQKDAEQKDAELTVPKSGNSRNGAEKRREKAGEIPENRPE